MDKIMNKMFDLSHIKDAAILAATISKGVVTGNRLHETLNFGKQQ